MAQRAYPAILMILAGCGPAVIVHDYPTLGLRINQASKSRVERECGSENAACAYSGMKPCEIWVYKPSDIPHELCHCAGGDETKCREDDW